MTLRDLEVIWRVCMAWWLAVVLIYLLTDFIARRRMHRRYAKRFTRHGSFSREGLS